MEVDYEIIDSEARPIVGCDILTVEGALISGGNSRQEGDGPACVGRHTARFEMGRLPLMEGRFRVDLRLEGVARYRAMFPMPLSSLCPRTAPDTAR